jgi:hypothetical protein
LSGRRFATNRFIGALFVFAALVLALTAFATLGEARPSMPRLTASPTPEFGEADGYIPDGETLSPFDMTQAAVANLDPKLRAAVQQAARDAGADGIEFVITSGWRSARYQQGLLDDAVVTYGSLAEAEKWVKTPEESTHVSGDAVDVGFTDADYWLIQYGYEYGLCQTYANEIWHFELSVEPGMSCPPPYVDASAR